jgi:CheY-like chemotaxis protein
MATVLVVEDDPLNAQMVSAMLMRARHMVLTRPDGVGALETIRSWSPHLILVDLALAGEMTGLDLCRAIRADPAIAATPIMIMSGWTFESDLEAGRAAGADDYLPKPFTFEELQDGVQRLLERSTAEITSSRHPLPPPTDECSG